MSMERREFLRSVGAVAGISALAPTDGVAALAEVQQAIAGVSGLPANQLAADERFWARVRRSYLATDRTDLDQAAGGPTAIPVLDAYTRLARTTNSGSYVFNDVWSDVHERVRPMLASYLGVPAPGELAIVSSATTALNTVLLGFPLERGDEILVTDHEYPDMLQALHQRATRDGIVVRTVRVPAIDEDRLLLVARMTDALTPRTRLALVSHVSAWSGDTLPVAELSAALRPRGIAVLVDAAQSVGVLPVNFAEIGCDFLGTSLHKWVGAPMATGALAMRPEHFGRVWPLHPMGNADAPPLMQLEWSGTFNVAERAVVRDALLFQRTLGAERKLARLRYLGSYWQERLRGEPRVRLLTSRDPLRFAGSAAFAIDGVPSAPLAGYLFDRHRIVVQNKARRYSPYDNAVRVSPGATTSTAELDRLVAAVRAVARRGNIPG